ncbi:MAG: ClpXP protease specificity-enhancing factor SspB [Polyangiaceae bacterium]
MALAILEQSMVNVHLDPRAEGVVVPPNFRRQPQLLLQIGLNMAKPIPDLYFDDEKMSCTLSFGQVPFFCIVPWTAVFAMVGQDGRGMVWPDSLPPEVARARAMPREATPEEKAAKLSAVPARKEDAKKETKKTARRKKDDKTAKAKPATKKSAAKKATARPKAKKTSDKKKAPKKAAADTRSDAPVVQLPERRAPKKEDAPRPQHAAKKPAGEKPKRELPPYLRVVK